VKITPEEEGEIESFSSTLQAVRKIKNEENMKNMGKKERR